MHTPRRIGPFTPVGPFRWRYGSVERVVSALNIAVIIFAAGVAIYVAVVPVH